MRKAFTYRIYLTNGQRRLLERQLEEGRWVSNETLAMRKNAWEQNQRTVNWYETNRALPLLKDTRPSLKLVHRQVLQNVTERVELAFTAFFRRGKAGESKVWLPAPTVICQQYAPTIRRLFSTPAAPPVGPKVSYTATPASTPTPTKHAHGTPMPTRETSESCAQFPSHTPTA